MYDLLIIGAGPAGMSAAISASQLGLKTVLLDDQAQPGGQIYRNVQNTSNDAVLGKDYVHGRDLVKRFLASGTEYRPDTRVWRVDEDGVCATGPDGSQVFKAKHVLLATGAMERPAPSTGWTLPGVMTAGSAQIMLKTSSMVAQDAVFIGSGPLLLLIVAQYIRAGVRVKAVLETTPSRNYLSAAKYAAGMLPGLKYLLKGVGLLYEIRKAGVRIERISSYKFEGDGALEKVVYRKGRTEHAVSCNTAFVHQGVIPAANASISTGCSHHWDRVQAAWTPETDPHGRTSVDWLRVAGDGAGIAGAISAEYTGELASLAVARDQGLLDETTLYARSEEPLKNLRRDRAIRPFLDQLYRPIPDILAPSEGSTTICRCELVTRDQIAEAASEGCPGPNQLKAFLRSGMGPCQGRMCGPLVTGILADCLDKPEAEIGHYRIRSPFRPVTVGEMADLQS